MNSAFAQSPQRNFYLIDSIRIEYLSKNDKKLLDSLLTTYHLTKIDTIKLDVLSELSLNLMTPQWISYNNLMHEQVNEFLKKPDLKNEEKAFYKAILATALNNKGIYCDNQGNIARALEYYHKSKTLF